MDAFSSLFSTKVYDINLQKKQKTICIKYIWLRKITRANLTIISQQLWNNFAMYLAFLCLSSPSNQENLKC